MALRLNKIITPNNYFKYCIGGGAILGAMENVYCSLEYSHSLFDFAGYGVVGGIQGMAFGVFLPLIVPTTFIGLTTGLLFYTNKNQNFDKTLVEHLG